MSKTDSHAPETGASRVFPGGPAARGQARAPKGLDGVAEFGQALDSIAHWPCGPEAGQRPGPVAAIGRVLGRGWRHAHDWAYDGWTAEEKRAHKLRWASLAAVKGVMNAGTVSTAVKALGVRWVFAGAAGASAFAWTVMTGPLVAAAGWSAWKAARNQFATKAETPGAKKPGGEAPSNRL